jgi:hypothetical protein
MNKFLLYKSDKKHKKYVMVMPSLKHKHYFGATGYKDYTLMSNKQSNFYEPSKEERNKIKERYLKRHAHEPKGMHTASTLSDMILWNKPTVRQSVQDYEKKYNVKIKIINDIYKNK